MITEREAYWLYDDMIDETYERVSIATISWPASQVLKKMDPVAYDCGFNDYVNSLIEDGEVVEGFNDDEEEQDDED